MMEKKHSPEWYAKKSPKVRNKKMKKVMDEWKAGSLHQGRTNKIVTNHKQAVAIGLSVTGQLKR